MSTLFIIATPIGNLGDISPRALETIKLCDYLVCENPGTTKKLLSKYEIHKTLRWYREDNHKSMGKIVLDDLIHKNLTIGLVSEAGTPVVSDPGSKLLADVHAAGVKVIPIPGASSVTTAISAFPLPSAKFLFWGFAPRKEGEFKRMIQNNSDLYLKEKMALILFESPFRMKKTLGYLSELAIELHERQIDLFVGVGSEMTKLHEAYVWDTPQGILARENRDFLLNKGEMTLVIAFKKRHNTSDE